MWQAGSIAFDRSDRWSDVDIYIVVDDPMVEAVFNRIEKIVVSLSGYDRKYRLPEPTWHGHSQVFYRLKKASPFLFLDIAVMRRSSKDKFLQYRIHGTPVVHFDKAGIIRDDPVDAAALLARLKERLKAMKETFKLFEVLTLKELNRGFDIIALNFYQSSVIRPLIEVLRIKYSPYHYNFHTAYLYYDLPQKTVARLRRLCFVKDGRELRKRHREAVAWFYRLLNSIDMNDVKALMGRGHA
jgi:hypothetical protein